MVNTARSGLVGFLVVIVIMMEVRHQEPSVNLGQGMDNRCIGVK
jgi:hypothetical protein